MVKFFLILSVIVNLHLLYTLGQASYIIRDVSYLLLNRLNDAELDQLDGANLNFYKLDRKALKTLRTFKKEWDKVRRG